VHPFPVESTVLARGWIAVALMGRADELLASPSIHS